MVIKKADLNGNLISSENLQCEFTVKDGEGDEFTGLLEAKESWYASYFSFNSDTGRLEIDSSIPFGMYSFSLLL